MNAPASIQRPLLAVEDLSTTIGGLRLVDEIQFTVAQNECVGIVGESGSGKSTLGLSLLRLVDARNRARFSGRILFEGRDILRMNDNELRQLRGRDIAMILQDPMTSLDPVFNVGAQVAEAILCHGNVSQDKLRRRVIDALTRVRIPEAESRVRSYPHQLSGGMRQRVVGAIAMACAPKLLIADEPTTSLDATIQAQFLQLLQDVQADLAMSLVVITHDFGVVAKMCDRVCVMYAGNIVESAPVFDIFDRPAHPYTRALIESRPRLHAKQKRLVSIPGSPPKPGDAISGCRFAPRCERVQEQCRREMPPPQTIASDHVVRCWFPLQSGGGL